MKLMFVDSGRVDVIVWLFDLDAGKVEEKRTVKGAPALVLGKIKSIISELNPDKLVIDKTGIGTGYSTAITKWFKKIKNGETE